ncbi:MAG: monofunctional biosynthetic peptidoglycan transglycosylase [Beijerinckiaceae bacterium]|nr:monofunctional biosynthetic peptidoglycan transglycosylase [Beijerinckiaceae bacterium]
MASRSRWTGFPGKFARAALGLSLALVLGFAALIFTYRYFPPVSTPMLARWIEGETADRHFVPLARISYFLRKAVIVSEDGRFCQHRGVDWRAIREVLTHRGADGPSRGASTITMQTAKNLFLWPSRSYFRKAIEIPLALMIDLEWPKRRTLEVYLNVAQWGEGVYGAEAAARRYFGKSAGKLDEREAALLATALPSPRHRNSAKPSRLHARLAMRLMARARIAGPVAECAE